jgi:hypothetical protein
MLSTALIALLILCLMGLSIQVGWGLTHLLLVIAFGGVGHQQADGASYGELGGRYFAIPKRVAPSRNESTTSL